MEPSAKESAPLRKKIRLPKKSTIRPNNKEQPDLNRFLRLAPAFGSIQVMIFACFPQSRGGRFDNPEKFNTILLTNPITNDTTLSARRPLRE